MPVFKYSSLMGRRETDVMAEAWGKSEAPPAGGPPAGGPTRTESHLPITFAL